MRILITVFVLAASLLLGAIGFAYSGLYNVAASKEHGGVFSWFLSTTSHVSIARRAADIEVPDLADAALIQAGINDFDSMCSGCHGAPGKSAGAMGQGLNPAAPDLAESAVDMQPSELFWVTKHGIRMTGMPAWGVTHDDESLWPVVAFMNTLPGLGADDYQALLASAADAGHHAPEETNDHGSEDSGPPAQAAPEGEPEVDDHSTHDHTH